MKRLATQQRAQILQMLCEGVSIRAITRMTGVSKNTVTKLLIDAGTVFADYQDISVTFPANGFKLMKFGLSSAAKERMRPKAWKALLGTYGHGQHFALIPS